ncbi:MAG: hypothetical protein JO301_14475 [Chitinophagaceae bacterium]|nr:hypothetical protein [Chitinophagaceae bacterium]
MQPVEGHGSWDGQQCFGELPRQSGYKEQIAVLTRATIRTGKLRRFWKHAAQAAPAPGIPGYRGSIGIGEMPWIKQATFSIWESSQHLKAWAYQSAAHSDVIRKTRSENWYSEEMFVRFAIRSVAGTIRGENPLERKA